MKKAFTLIEILITIAIIIIFTTLTVVSFGPGRQNLALIRSAYKLSQDIRRTCEMALSSKEFQGSIPKKYGLYFERDSNSYILFVDMNGNNQYEEAEKIEEIFLESKVKISSLSFNPLTITFEPPDPLIFISGEDKAEIILSSEIGSSKVIKINKFGLIDID